MDHFEGLKVAINDPFSGSIVPATGFRYKSMMIEVNKRLYMDEQRLEEFPFAYKFHFTLCSLYRKLLKLP